MQGEDAALLRAQQGDEAAFARLVAPYRREIRAHCYRMSGSLHDADDLLQEALLRAWKGLASFEGRASLRTWLYKVTTRACLDALEKRSARVLPTALGPPADPKALMAPPRMEPVWIEPCPDDLFEEDKPTPEATYSARESVALAFLVALQELPPKQRAALILRDVLGWEASDCARTLDLSVAAVNSALQRARESVTARAERRATVTMGADVTSTLAQYVDAWERADVTQLVALLREDATLAMPPLSEWILGAAAIGEALRGMVLTPDARGQFRLVPTRANGLPAFAAYRRDETGAFRASALHLLDVRDGRIAAITAFLDPSLFEPFGLASVGK